jgi:hypothetical protein
MNKLPEDIENKVMQYLGLKCHVCQININKLKILKNIYKIQGKFIFCSSQCYNHI